MARGVYRRDPPRQPYRRRPPFLPTVIGSGTNPSDADSATATDAGESLAVTLVSADTGVAVEAVLVLDTGTTVVTPVPGILLHPVLFSPAQQFTFLAEDILSGQIKAALPLDAWAYDDTLNRPGSLTAAIPLASDYATEELLDPYRTAIYVLRDGRVEWGGRLLPPMLQVGSPVLDLGCVGWLGYWDSRDVRTDYTPTGVDQFEIFEQLIADAQDEGTFGDGYDLGITVTWDALSGVLRDRTYRAFETKNLGEALRQLAAVIGGFDFAMTYTLNTTTDRVDKALKLYYPHKGRDTGFLFEYERGMTTNVIARGFADPVKFAWTGAGWGSGNDETRITSTYIDETLRGVYPPQDAAPSYSAVTEQATLDENTATYFARTNRPRPVPSLRIDPDKHPLWGDYETGDTVNVRIIDGYGSTGVTAQSNRVTGRNVTADNVYELVFADPFGTVPEES